MRHEPVAEPHGLRRLKVGKAGKVEKSVNENARHEQQQERHAKRGAGRAGKFDGGNDRTVWSTINGRVSALVAEADDWRNILLSLRSLRGTVHTFLLLLALFLWTKQGLE